MEAVAAPLRGSLQEDRHIRHLPWASSVWALLPSLFSAGSPGWGASLGEPERPCAFDFLGHGVLARVPSSTHCPLRIRPSSSGRFLWLSIEAK